MIITETVVNTWVEIPLLLSLGWGGCGLLALLGVKRPLFVAGAGIVGFSAVLLVLFPVNVAFQLAPSTLALPVAGTLGLIALLLQRTRILHLQSMAWYGGAVAFAWAVRYVFQLPERVGEDALAVMMQAVFELQESEPPGDYRRGFALPLLLAMAREGNILGALIPLLVVCVVYVTISSAQQVLGKYERWVVSTSLIAGGGVVVSAPIFAVMAGYTNGHVLMALSVSVVLVASLRIIQKLEIGHTDVIVIGIAAFVGALTRFEGAALILVAMAPLLIFSPHPSLNPSRTRLMVLSLSPGFGTSYWLVFGLETGLLTDQLVFAGVALAGPLLFLGATHLMGVRRQHLVVGFAWIFLLSLPIITLFSKYSLGLIELIARVQAINLVLGVSGWGIVIPTTLILVLMLRRQRRDRLLNASIQVLSWGVLATISLKLIDSPPISQGFNDTISRTLFHWLSPLILVWVIGLASRLSMFVGVATARRELPIPLPDDDVRTDR